MDVPTAVAVDGEGNCIIGGWTRNSIGGTNAGGWDVFVVKYDATGAVLWSRQFGTPADEEMSALAIRPDDSIVFSGHGLAYVVGAPTDQSIVDASFVGALDADGQMLWIRQIPVPPDASGALNVVASSISVDAAGSVFLAGEVDGQLGIEPADPGATDYFLAKFDPQGNLLPN